MHYSKVLQSLCKDFFKSPPGGRHLSCIFQNIARLSPQTLPYFLFQLYLNPMSIFCPLHQPYCICLCPQAPRVLLTPECTLSRVSDFAFSHYPVNLKRHYFLLRYCKYRLDLETEILLYVILPFIRETQDTWKQQWGSNFPDTKNTASGTQFDESSKCPISEFFEGKKFTTCKFWTKKGLENFNS